MLSVKDVMDKLYPHTSCSTAQPQPMEFYEALEKLYSSANGSVEIIIT